MVILYKKKRKKKKKVGGRGGLNLVLLYTLFVYIINKP
jgi:hypothetical protein